jgi:hypothetical protein
MLSDSLKEALAIGIILSVLGSDLLYFVILPRLRESKRVQTAVRVVRREFHEHGHIGLVGVVVFVLVFAYLTVTPSKTFKELDEHDAHTAPSRELSDAHDRD